jgi:hypothetical protein
MPCCIPDGERSGRIETCARTTTLASLIWPSVARPGPDTSLNRVLVNLNVEISVDLIPLDKTVTGGPQNPDETRIPNVCI